MRIRGWVRLPDDCGCKSGDGKQRGAGFLVRRSVFVGALVALVGVACFAFSCGSGLIVCLSLCLAAALLLCVKTINRRIRRLQAVSVRDVMRANKQRETAMEYLPKRYEGIIKGIRPVSWRDRANSNRLLAEIANQLVSVGAYEEAGESRVSWGGRRKVVHTVEAYAATINGRGYILLEPFGREIAVCASVDKGVIYRALRDAGMRDWEVERISYDDDILLFLIFDPNSPNFFDLAVPNMHERFLELAETAGKHEIPLQPELYWDMGLCPHAIIAGPSGSGKTYLLNYIFTIAGIKGCYLLAADPKNSDLAAMREFMPPERVAFEPKQILRLVDEAVEIMRQRYEIMSDMRNREAGDSGLFQADYRSFGFVPVLLCIDEIAAFASSLDRQQRAQFESSIKEITLQGRQSGVGLVSLMQQPNAVNISTESRSQAGLRVMLGNATPSECRMLFGEGFEPSRLPRCSGQGYCTVLGKTLSPVRFQAPRFDKAQIAATMRCALSKQKSIDPLSCGLNRSEAKSEPTGQRGRA